MKAWVRNSTGKAIHWGRGHSVNRRTLRYIFVCAHSLPKSQLQLESEVVPSDPTFDTLISAADCHPFPTGHLAWGRLQVDSWSNDKVKNDNKGPNTDSKLTLFKISTWHHLPLRRGEGLWLKCKCRSYVLQEYFPWATLPTTKTADRVNQTINTEDLPTQTRSKKSMTSNLENYVHSLLLVKCSRQCHQDWGVESLPDLLC